MKLQITKKTALFFLLVVFFVFIDKFFKTLVEKDHLNKPIYLINDFFSLHFIPNKNIAFSLPLSGRLLSVFIVLLILGLIIWLIKVVSHSLKTKINDPLIFPLTILILGATLNLIDRIKFGYVIDYFDLKYFTVFNVADIMISLSVIYILFISLFKKPAN